MESEINQSLQFQFGDSSEVENNEVERETRQYFDLELIEPTKNAENSDESQTHIPVEVLVFK